MTEGVNQNTGKQLKKIIVFLERHFITDKKQPSNLYIYSNLYLNLLKLYSMTFQVPPHPVQDKRMIKPGPKKTVNVSKVNLNRV